MLKNLLWTWLGFMTLIVGAVLTSLMWTGFQGAIDCGTWGFDCVFYSVLTLPTVLGISSFIFWLGVPVDTGNVRKNTFARIIAIVTTTGFAIVMAGLVFPILAIGGRG
jgi:hypothetical protein